MNPKTSAEVAERPERRAAAAVGRLGRRPPGRVAAARAPLERHAVRVAEQPRPHHRRQLVADGLGELGRPRPVASVRSYSRNGPPRAVKRSRPSRHLRHEVVAGLRGRVGCVLGREHPDEGGHSVVVGVGVALGLVGGGSAVGDGEEPAEQPDRHQHEEQLVPPALVGERATQRCRSRTSQRLT